MNEGYKHKPLNYTVPVYARLLGISTQTLRYALNDYRPMKAFIHRPFQKFMGDNRDYSKLLPVDRIRCLDERMVQLAYQNLFGENGVSDFQSNLWVEKQEGGEP